VKVELAERIDARPEEIALNRNSREGLCAAIFGVPLSPGDQVLGPLNGMRVSPHIYTLEEELDRFADALDRVVHASR
jgi:selenocysteine lyase/cysteine desulfurase